MKRKPLVIIMGACAAGKSTLGCYLLGTPVEELSQKFTVQALNRAGVPQPPAPEEVKYCVNPKTGMAVAGNRAGGSDCINSRAGLQAVTAFLVALPRVKAVVVNSVRFSQASDIYEAAANPRVRPIYICFQLSPQENLKRLLGRREGEPLTPSGEANFERFRHRNNLNLAKARAVYGTKLELIVADDKATPAKIAAQLRTMISA